MKVYVCFLRPSSLCSSSSSLAVVPDVGLLKSELEQLDEMLDKFKEEPNKAKVNVLSNTEIHFKTINCIDKC